MSNSPPQYKTRKAVSCETAFRVYEDNELLLSFYYHYFDITSRNIDWTFSS
jgi:hypothetical protein